MISRIIQGNIISKIGRGKAIILLGPRQVGKTTLIKHLLENKDFQFFNGDDPTDRTALENVNTEQIRALIGKKKIVFVDEAQRIQNIGLTLKIITDQFKDVQLWISGSSSFSLYNELNEPLTGRKWEYQIFPISWEEFENHYGYLHASKDLENRLRFGMYPEVINHPGEEIEILKDLVSSYLFKDVLAFAGIKKAETLDRLVQALALQVGSEVNYNELSRFLGIDKVTVERYINILEQTFIVFKLPSYSRNVRNELKKGKKIYFYDNGVRNTVIKAMNELPFRLDKGAIWENFLVSERLKYNQYHLNLSNSYFWRTTQQQEIDYIEEANLKLQAYEFKWEKGKHDKPSKTFMDNYDSTFDVITRENFRDFVMSK